MLTDNVNSSLLPYLSELALALALLFGWVFALQVIRERRTPAATLAWVAVLVLFPILGVLIYLLVGTRKRELKHVRLRGLSATGTAALHFEQAHVLDRMLRRLSIPPASIGNDIEIAWRPDAAMQGLLGVIDGARERLWLLIYIFEDDDSGCRVLEALVRAAERGVTVRVMVDDLGSYGRIDASRRALEAAGGQIIRFKPVWYALWKRMVNLRNHRKIVVADGETAWTGGRNIGDHYLRAGKSEWLDLSAVITGPAALALEEICRNDWSFTTGVEAPLSPILVHPAEGPATIQVLPSGPEYREDLWHAALVKGCFEAHTRLWVATPYFVPDETVMNAIVTAARSGIDVRILIPHRSDNLIVDMVGRSYLREVQRTGAKVFRYKLGMMHAKAVLVDDQLALLGSANVDARSFFLNYECTLVGYDESTTRPVSAFFEYGFARANKGVRPVSRITESLTSVARLFSPML